MIARCARGRPARPGSPTEAPGSSPRPFGGGLVECWLGGFPAGDVAIVTTAADGWDLTVPDDPSELWAELRRHGIEPGQRLHVVPGAASEVLAEGAVARPRRNLKFVASFSAEADLGRNADDYLAEDFGRE